MATYNFKNPNDPLYGNDIKNLYINLIKARTSRGMSASSESLIPEYQFEEITGDMMQTITNEASKSSEQLNYRYQFPNYSNGTSYATGKQIFTDWYNQLEVVTKDMARKADCSSGCIGMCVATCSSTCQTECYSNCGSSCSDNCSSDCRSSNCIKNCSNTCTSNCGTSCDGRCDKHCINDCYNICTTVNCSKLCRSDCVQLCGTTCESTFCGATCKTNNLTAPWS